MDAFKDNHEVLFAICMVAVAVVGRDSPILDLPGAQWAFGSLLAANLAFRRFPRRLEAALPTPLLTSAANTLLVSWVLAATGGEESRFWTMYLLPVLSASLTLAGARLLFAVAAPGAFLAYFHLEGVWSLPALLGWEYLAKLGVLGFSAALCARSAAAERRSREALLRARGDLDRLASDAREAASKEIRHGLRRAAHDANNMLTVIMGSADLAAAQAPREAGLQEDLARIKEASRRAGRLLDGISADLKCPAPETRAAAGAPR